MSPEVASKKYEWCRSEYRNDFLGYGENGLAKRPTRSNNYFAIHKWLEKHFKKELKCEICSKDIKTQWALIKGKEHSHNRDNYFELCYSCHRKYDISEADKNRLRTAWIGKSHTEETKQKQSETMKKIRAVKKWKSVCKKCSICKKYVKLNGSCCGVNPYGRSS